jgi:O-antigen/teichoic acid export membrane protein
MALSPGEILNRIKSSFTSGHERSIKAKKNILASLVIRGCSIAISLVLVPLTINYINTSRYGIWLTLSSIVAWLSFFDIGLTQGLRNKFAEAKARGDDALAQIYVSTTYALLAIIFCAIWLPLCANNFLNWSVS